MRDSATKKRNLRWVQQITSHNKEACCVHAHKDLARMHNISLVNKSQNPAFLNPRGYICTPPLSIYLSFNHCQICAVNDACAALDVFVEGVRKGGDNLGERDKRCHLFSGTLQPISRADQPHSPRHLQQLADND